MTLAALLKCAHGSQSYALEPFELTQLEAILHPIQQEKAHRKLRPIDEDPQSNLIQANQELSNYIRPSKPGRRPPRRISSWISITLSQIASSDSNQCLSELVLSTLGSDLPEETVQSTLLDLIGFHHIHLIEPILSIRPFLKSRQKLHEFDLDELNIIKAQALVNAANSPLFSRPGFVVEEAANPHIFTSSNSTSLNWSGKKYALPVGTTRTSHELYEEITIPPAPNIPMRAGEQLIKIHSLDPIARGSFPGYDTLNRLQSVVYPIAYKTNENMLVCAPTGAGKTDVAMLTILRAISQYAGLGFSSASNKPIGKIRNDFKVIYVAPMKALAAEIVRKMGKRLKWLDFAVKELTGDMQLTKAEINATHLIVTTPEKWDVVTRKASGEEDLVSKVRLLIIDEVHLLHEERGAVIETIVARTLRQVESSQSLIRIVGLSATLPNYIDVSDFLRVNRLQGLFYFDSSFRPVPLEQHFIGAKGKPNSTVSRNNLDTIAFQKVSRLVQDGHQVMVFVHARKETVKTAQMIREKAIEEGILELFDPTDHEKYDSFRREISASKNKEMKELVRDGLGIHHAGMLRQDRNISERLFESGVTKVLCCTATLAWGVNLPAYAVIIKGTQIYDASKGSFVDLGILDVLQIFGRAGRPQYEDHGVGFICTTHDSLDHYVGAISQQHPIESEFIRGIVDSLNAEIALGTVTTVDEGVQWIGWTYLFVRMRKNPMIYGLSLEDVADDPWLGRKRHSLIVTAAKQLKAIGMIFFEEDLGSLLPTELGRIASKYYVKYASVEIFVKGFRARMSEADVLAMLSEGVEFEQIKVRESEAEELERLQADAPCQVKGGPTTTAGKVNILLQAHVSRAYVEDFALVSDTAYVAQNAARIARALVEMAISKRYAETSRVLIDIGKCIDKRMWPFAHPLLQSGLSDKLIYDLDQRAGDVEVEDLAQMSAAEIGEMCHLNERLGGVILKAARQFPRLSIGYALQPLSSELLRIKIEVSHEFEWSTAVHGQGEPFWIWIEDEKQEEIKRITRVWLRASNPEFVVKMVIPIGAGKHALPGSLAVKVISDRWVGADGTKEIDLKGIIVPPQPPAFTPLLDLPLLSTNQLELGFCPKALPNHFDPVETQCFHAVNHTPADLLICAPDLQVSRRLAMVATDRALRLLGEDSGKLIIFVLPTKVLARQIYHRLQRGFRRTRVKVGLLIDSAKFDLDNLKSGPGCSLIVLSPDAGPKLMTEGRGDVVLTILMDLHLLDAAYERLVAVVRRWKTSRLVGFASTLSDARSLAAWLGIPLARQVFNFPTSTRVQPFKRTIQPHPIPQPLLLVKAVAKLLGNAMGGSVLVFVPSRQACKPVGRALVQSLVAGGGSEAAQLNAFEGLGGATAGFVDRELNDLLLHGVIVLYEGMSVNEQERVLGWFSSGLIRRMVVSRDMCWRFSVKAQKVVVMGTGSVGKELGVDELVQMESFVGGQGNELEFVVMCGNEQVELFESVLERGMSLESMRTLPGVEDLDGLLRWLVSKKCTIGRSEVGGYLMETFIGHRVKENGWYYGIQIHASTERVGERALSSLVDRWVDGLVSRSCLKAHGELKLGVTRLGELIISEGYSIGMVDQLKKILDNDSKMLIKEAEFEAQVVTDNLVQAEVFFGKMPRYMKDQIGNVEIHDGEWLKRVLVLGFGLGRIPFGHSQLEELQAQLVFGIMKRMM